MTPTPDRDLLRQTGAHLELLAAHARAAYEPFADSPHWTRERRRAYATWGKLDRLARAVLEIAQEGEA